jgi:hypothetical protein
LKFELVKVPFCPGCEAHKGFLQSFEAEKNTVLQGIEEIRKNAAYKGYGLVITGHSLGGAIASIAAAHFRSKGEKPDLYTYGAPRIGNDAFSAFVEAPGKGKNSFVTNLDDPVPKIPFKAFGYGYMNPAYHINADKAGQETADDVEVVKKRNAELDPKIGLKLGLQFADDHLHYFSKLAMNACI